MSYTDTPMIDPEVNPHLALWQAETYQSPEDRAWSAWYDKLVALFGNPDGSQVEDGYSLDNFYDMWEAGYSVETAIANKHIVLKPGR